MSRYAVVIEQAEGNLSAYVPDLPGCVSTGATLDEVEANIAEAIQLHIESLQAHGEPVPPPTPPGPVEHMFLYPRSMSGDAAMFWSYVRADDDAQHGRITRLAQAVAAEYALNGGEELELFVDRTNLRWGDAWKDRIDAALARTTFFVAILTPRYLQSSECRRELLQFANEAKSLGTFELLLPIMYIEPRDTDDDLMTLVQQFQREDWTELRLADEDSAVHRSAVAKLALRLLEAARAVETRAVSPALTQDHTDEEEDAPGLMERLADVGDQLPQLNARFESLKSAMDRIGEAFRIIGTPAGQNPRAQVAVAHRLAEALRDPVDEFESAATSTAADFNQFDVLLGELFRWAEASPVFAKQITPVLADLEQLQHQVGGSSTSMIEFSQMIGGMENLSRELRQPLRRLSYAIRSLTDVVQMVERWGVKAHDLSLTEGST